MPGVIRLSGWLLIARQVVPRAVSVQMGLTRLPVRVSLYLVAVVGLLVLLRMLARAVWAVVMEAAAVAAALR